MRKLRQLVKMSKLTLIIPRSTTLILYNIKIHGHAQISGSFVYTEEEVVEVVEDLFEFRPCEVIDGTKRNTELQNR